MMMMIRISNISIWRNKERHKILTIDKVYYLARLLQLRSEIKQVVIAENFESLYSDESMFHHPE